MEAAFKAVGNPTTVEVHAAPHQQVKALWRTHQESRGGSRTTSATGGSCFRLTPTSWRTVFLRIWPRNSLESRSA
jgi:hypothetical protein